MATLILAAPNKGTLVLSRRVNESLFIGEDIKITLVSVTRGHAKISITAPREIRVDRSEIRDLRQRDAEDAARQG